MRQFFDIFLSFKKVVDVILLHWIDVYYLAGIVKLVPLYVDSDYIG